MSLLNSALIDGTVTEIFYEPRHYNFFMGKIKFTTKDKQSIELPFKALDDIALNCIYSLKKDLKVRILGALTPMANSIGILAERVEIMDKQAI